MDDRQRGIAMGRAVAASSIPFVLMAQAEQIDDVTITEHPELFVQWSTHSAYVARDIVRYETALYRCVQAHTSQASWTPTSTPALWVRIGDPGEEWPAWSQPIGAHDAYGVGDKVTHGGKRWVSTANGNVWAPGVYGWDEIK